MSTETLENFVDLHDNVAKARRHISTIAQDPYDRDVYSKTIKETARRTGRDPRTLNPQTQQYEELSPRTIRELLEAWYQSAKNVSVNYADENLEALLNGLEEDKFSRLLLFTRPNKDGGEVENLHGDYNKMYVLLDTYRKSKEPEQRTACVEAMRKKVPELVRGRIKRFNDERKADGDNDVLDEEGVEMWTKALTYVSFVNAGFALQVYSEGISEKYDELRKRLGDITGLRNYVAGNVKDLSSELKDTIVKAGTETDADKRKDYEDLADELKDLRERFNDGLYEVARAA